MSQKNINCLIKKIVFACVAFVSGVNVALAESGQASSSGNKGKVIMVASAGAAIATATVLKAPCKSATGSAWACPLMAIALGQAASSLLSSKGAGASSEALSSGSSSTTLTADGSSAKATNTSSALAGEIGTLEAIASDLKQDLQSAGYILSADASAVTGPDGKSVSTSTFGSLKSMEAAGFDVGQIEAMEATIDAAKKAANDKFKKIASNLSNDVGGAGGGGKGEDSGGSGGSGGYGFDVSKFLSKNAKLKGNSVAGMSKKLGTDNIGVAGDNIFEMITRRYQARDQQNNFIVDVK